MGYSWNIIRTYAPTFYALRQLLKDLYPSIGRFTYGWRQVACLCRGKRTRSVRGTCCCTIYIAGNLKSTEKSFKWKWTLGRVYFKIKIKCFDCGVLCAGKLIAFNVGESTTNVHLRLRDSVFKPIEIRLGPSCLDCGLWSKNI